MIPFERHTMSGMIPPRWQAKSVPVRPQPIMTSFMQGDDARVFENEADIR